MNELAENHLSSRHAAHEPMSTTKRISQREAMRMRKELKSLRYLKDRLSSDWVGMRMRIDAVHAETREAVRVGDASRAGNDYVVIGNIHENPELLNQTGH